MRSAIDLWIAYEGGIFVVRCPFVDSDIPVVGGTFEINIEGLVRTAIVDRILPTSLDDNVPCTPTDCHVIDTIR